MYHTPSRPAERHRLRSLAHSSANARKLCPNFLPWSQPTCRSSARIGDAAESREIFADAPCSRPG
jgi:hypothetical protein